MSDHSEKILEKELRGADLREANLQGASLREADIREAYLQGANLQGADLREATLQGANLQGADLREAYFQGSNLQGSNLRGADLRDADLQGAYLRGACLQGACLRDEKLKKEPMQIIGLKYFVLITAEQIQIGCKHHKVEEWKNFTDDEILKIDNDAGLKWWKENKDFIFMCHKKYLDEYYAMAQRRYEEVSA